MQVPVTVHACTLLEMYCGSRWTLIPPECVLVVLASVELLGLITLVG